MSGELLRRQSGLAAIVPTRLDRELVRVEQQALIRAQRVQSVCFVGAVAMNGVTQLSVTQDQCAKLAPGSELRLAGIADATAAVVESIILRMMVEG